MFIVSGDDAFQCYLRIFFMIWVLFFNWLQSHQAYMERFAENRNCDADRIPVCPLQTVACYFCQKLRISNLLNCNER